MIVCLSVYARTWVRSVTSRFIRQRERGLTTAPLGPLFLVPFSHKQLRQHFRSVYLQNATLSTRPTPKGRDEIKDEAHPCYGLHYLQARHIYIGIVYISYMVHSSILVIWYGV
jgi:hypothetical protein